MRHKEFKKQASASVDWAPKPKTDWGNEAKYYLKGLKHLPSAFKETIADSAHDSAIAVPRGVMRGTNALVNIGAGEMAGLSDFGARYINDKLDKYAPEAGKDTMKRWMMAPLRGFSQHMRNTQDLSNRTTNTFLDYYKYRDPSNIGARTAEAVGTLLPGAYALSAVGGVNNASRLFTPVRMSDATGALRLIPSLAKNPALAAVDSVLASPAYNIATNAVATGIPLADYAFGFTHQNPDDSKAIRQTKEFISKLPSAVGVINPAAFINYKLNTRMERMLPRMEYLGRETPEIAALAADREKGIAGHVAPHVEKYVQDWWNEPMHLQPYQKYIDDTVSDAWRYGIDAAKQRQPQRQAELKQTLQNGPSEVYLRWLGIQPSARPKGADYGYTPKEKLQLGRAFNRGFQGALQSEDTREAMLGRDPKALYDNARSIWDQASQYKALGNTDAATAIIIDNIPELYQQFMAMQNNQ